MLQGVQPVTSDLTEMLLNKTWRAQLEVTGGDLPATKGAGNVLRTETTLKLSVRLPPTLEAKTAAAALQKTLTENPPYGAKVTLSGDHVAKGWDAPAMTEHLSAVVDRAAKTYYDGKPPVGLGEGGSIPFMGMLAAKFPQAQFIITGVLGPNSNAHGPNEMLHIEFAKRLTCTVAQILADL